MAISSSSVNFANDKLHDRRRCRNVVSLAATIYRADQSDAVSTHCYCPPTFRRTGFRVAMLTGLSFRGCPQHRLGSRLFSATVVVAPTERVECTRRDSGATLINARLSVLPKTKRPRDILLLFLLVPNNIIVIIVGNDRCAIRLYLPAEMGQGRTDARISGRETADVGCASNRLI